MGLSGGVGRKEDTPLLGEAAPRAYCPMTAAFVEFLAQADAEKATITGLSRILSASFGEGMTVAEVDVTSDLPFFFSSHEQEVAELMAELEQQPLREIVADLQRVITARKEQGDNWAEGRLNVGIALEALGEIKAAQDRLEEAEDVLVGRGPR